MTEFETHRSHLTKLAYRMLGTVSDAEDVVQETYLRWNMAGEPQLENPRGWFARTCTRLCLDNLKSAHSERAEYRGEWLPEPLVPPAEDSREELDDTLSMALLTTIQKLKPAERAAFLLHDVFAYPFEQVAEILDLESANCRQLASRARRNLGGERKPNSVDANTVAKLSDAFFRAINLGDLGSLRSVLADGVVMHADGGGKVSASLQPIHGLEKVVRFFDRIFISAREPAPVNPQTTWFNGGPGILLMEAGLPVSAFQFEVVDGKIAGIFVQRNPDKLRALRTAMKVPASSPESAHSPKN